MCWCLFVFFFKQKTAYELTCRDWSSDVCSSDLQKIGCLSFHCFVGQGPENGSVDEPFHPLDADRADVVIHDEVLEDPNDGILRPVIVVNILDRKSVV